MRFVAMMNFRLQRVLMFVKRLGSHGGSGGRPVAGKDRLILRKFAGMERKPGASQWVKFPPSQPRLESDSGPALALVFEIDSPGSTIG